MCVRRGDVTIVLLASAVAAVYKSGFLSRRALGRLLLVSGSAEGWEGWSLHPAGERAEGLCHCEFSLEGFGCSRFLSSVLPSLLDRLGDSKDSVREQDQTLLLKIMEQAASPQVCSIAFCIVSE